MKRTFSPLLLLCLCTGILLADLNCATRSAHAGGGKSVSRKDKFSAGLRGSGDGRVGVVLQLKGRPSGKLNALLSRNGVHVRAQLKSLNVITVELPASAVEELASFEEVEFVSADSEVASFGHVSSTTGADAVRTQTTKTLLGTTTTTLDGTGVGIAVVDSGVDAKHTSFLDKSNGVRVVKSVDFTGEGRTDDPFGHGTHVAAAAAGNGRISNAAYVGVAPNANIVNLRVLNSKGTGSTSSLLSALDWLLQNRSAYNIRVVNLSLGTLAVDSYRNDPLCKAVRRLVDAGVVVVAAAGNNGKDSAGRKVYGQIHSPGDEPSALTVGATNTFGTDSRSDDAVTTYSSRGPTRGTWTDAAGVRRHDNLLKPDLVAPGNKLVYAKSAGNLLVAENPHLDAGVSPVAVRDQMFLNGTSMAAPVAAGAAALLFQANPRLTPNMVKVAMMYTAQQLKGFNTLEQGAGQLNVEGAVKLAKLFKTDLLSSLLGGTLLTTSTPPSPQTTIAGQTFTWSQGVVMGSTFAMGVSLITKYQRVYGAGSLLGDGVVLGDGALMADGALLSDGVVLGDHVLTSGGALMADGIPFLGCSVLMGDGALLSDGSLLGDGSLLSDGALLSDGSLLSDFTLQAQSAQALGDGTPSMKVAVDTGVDYLGY